MLDALRKNEPKTILPEEEITEDLLANVPELDGAPDVSPLGTAGRGFEVEDEDAIVETVVTPASGFTLHVDAAPRPYPLGGEAPAITPTPFPLGGAPPPLVPLDVDPAQIALPIPDLVGHARAAMEGAFQGELARIETSVGALVTQMEAQLAQAELELAAVKAEHDKVKAETERKVEALRDLKRALADI